MTAVQPSHQAPPPPQPAGTFPNAWTLFRVRGIPVKLDRSWLLIAGLVAFYFYDFLRVSLAGTSTPVLLVLAAVAALLFFASILAHELGHALTSLSRNIPVLSITLFVMGGVTESTREADRARDEFVIVGIGPFISLLLAAAFAFVEAVTGAMPLVAVVAGYLGWANLALAVFNIVPGYPLDGGRILRSILWGATGKPLQSTRWAARVGQAFAAALIALGVVGFATGGGSGFGGLWEVFIGFFLFRGATSSHRRAQLRERLARRTVREAMGTAPPPLQGSWSLGQALTLVQERPSLLWPVGDPVQGTLLLQSLRDVPAEEWETTRVADIAIDPGVSTLDVESTLDEALERMINSPENMLVVTEQGRPIGLLTPSLVSDVAG